MSAKPILFNTEMVRAILDGRKTVTRRLIKPQHLRVLNSIYHREHPEVPDKTLLEVLCEPPYHPGDILYVRETWFNNGSRYMYRANYSESEKFYCDGKEIAMKWYPSIHMPKKAARIWLKVMDVRVKRLQDIDDDGAKEEGANYKNGKNVGLEEKMRRTAVERFAELWDSTIKNKDLDKYGWNANPWVWVIEFERCEKPEEE